MINRNEHEILAILERRLSEHRFQHSVAVAQAARELAAIFGEEEDLAYKTGLLHDYAKGIPAPQLIAIASENGLIEDEIENKVPICCMHRWSLFAET